MEYKDISIESIKEAMESFLYIPTKRKVKMYTNAYGADMFREALEENVTGKKRVYIGKKVPRWLRKGTFRINKSVYTKRYYRVI